MRRREADSPAVHNHPLSVESICCPDHVYEMCSYFQKQGRDEEVIFSLLSLTDLLDTTYLLDTSQQAQHRKKALVGFANEFSLYCGNSETLDIATSLLSVAETLLGALRVDEEAEGLRVTTLLNIAFLSFKEGNAQKALEALEEAEKLEQTRKDAIGMATVRISLSSVLIHMENYEDGHLQAQQAFRILEEEQQKTRDFGSQKLRGLMIAAKLSIASASEHLYEGKNSTQLFDLKTSLIECVETKTQMQESGVKMREYDGSPIQPIQRGTHRKTTTSSNMAEDFRSFCERVQGWEKDKAIENPSFLTIRETKDDYPPVVTDTPKTPSKLTPPTPRERRVNLETSLTLNRPSQEDSAIISYVRARRTQKGGKRVLLRMPNSLLPQIPTRSSAFKYSHLTFFQFKPRPVDYKKLLKRLLTARSETLKTQKVVENSVFTVNCVLNSTNIVFSASSAKGDNPPDEVLTLEELLCVLDILLIDGVAPKYAKAGLLLSLVDFAQFCLFPFLQIAAPGQRISKRIEFWSYSPGLLPNAESRLFLNKRKRISVHQIGDMMLRVVLSDICNAPKPETDITFEVKLDAGLKAKYGLTWEGSTDLKLLKAEFLSLLDPVFTEIGTELKTDKRFILVRVLMSAESPDLIVTRVEDVRPLRSWVIVAAKLKDAVRSLESISLPYSFLISRFGLVPSTLSLEETELLAGFVLDSLIVHVLSNTSSGESLVHMSAVEEISGWRTIVKHNGENVPVTLALIGVKNRVIGVKGTAWSVQSTLESGCLWYVESANYRKAVDGAGASQSKKRKKLEKVDRLSEIAEKETSLLSQLEEKNGWSSLLKSISLGTGKEIRMSVTGSDGNKRVVDRLETYLTPN